MPDADAATLVARIHAAPIRLVLAITGGGSRAISELLEVPGGSRTLLEAVVPYSSAALETWLGAAPEQFCSARTARAMAMAAFLRGRKLLALTSVPEERTDADVAVAGIGCTASLVSDRPKRGAHRVHVAWQSSSTTACCSIEFVKSRRSRPEEEAIAAKLVLNAAADAGGLTDRLELKTHSDEPVGRERVDAPAAWQDLLAGTIAAVRHENGIAQTRGPKQTRPRALFPGAFNPLHDGHRRMIELAAKILRLPVEAEISIENVDKPPLDFIELERRLRQFEGQTVWFTRAPTFVRKAELFPGVIFVVGADTIRRIADPRYYGGDPLATSTAIDRIREHRCRFLVFARACEGHLETLCQLTLSERLRELCTEVPIEQFRLDISSTALRRSDPD